MYFQVDYRITTDKRRSINVRKRHEQDLSGLIDTYLGKQLQWGDRHNRLSKFDLFKQIHLYATAHISKIVQIKQEIISAANVFYFRVDVLMFYSPARL